MSVHAKAIFHLIREKLGPLQFQNGECITIPEEQYQLEWGKAEAVVDSLLGSIDWNRVVFSAFGRHVTEDHVMSDVEPNVCGDDIRWALMEDLGVFDPHWTKSPYRNTL